MDPPLTVFTYQHPYRWYMSLYSSGLRYQLFYPVPLLPSSYTLPWILRRSCGIILSWPTSWLEIEATPLAEEDVDSVGDSPEIKDIPFVQRTEKIVRVDPFKQNGIAYHIGRTSPFPMDGWYYIIFLHSFNKTFCQQTVKTLIRHCDFFYIRQLFQTLSFTELKQHRKIFHLLNSATNVVCQNTWYQNNVANYILRHFPKYTVRNKLSETFFVYKFLQKNNRFLKFCYPCLPLVCWTYHNAIWSFCWISTVAVYTNLYVGLYP